MDGYESYRQNKNYIFKILILALICTIVVLTVYCTKISDVVTHYKEKYNNECVQAMLILKSNQSLTSNNNTNKIQSDKLNNQYNELKKQNEQIKKEVEALKKLKEKLEASKNELIADNLELQKSLKKAASVGVTPQSFKIYDGESLETSNNKGKYLGKFLGTAYTPSSDECGNDLGITSSGKPIIPGVSVAIDNKHWPYGTVFYIKGLGFTVAMDTGSAIKGKKRFDFAVLDKDFANELGH
ncbi:MAG: 3D domain-containing protein, partial [Ruminiclostridium sp.]